jgi:hypothetical protein
MGVQFFEKSIDLFSKPSHIDGADFRSKELSDLDIEGLSNCGKGLNGDIDLTALDTTVVAGVEVSLVSDILLGHVLEFSLTSDVKTESSLGIPRHRCHLLPRKL